MSEETSTATDRAAVLRGQLVDELSEWEPFRVAAVEHAMRAVPRHLFLPDTSLEQAYSHNSVITYRDSDGVPVSCASQPGTVGAMLEQLDVAPGHRLLEIGAGTGYNAALLAYLTGPQGDVTTIDIDEDVVADAQRNLAAAGYERVRVVHGDAEHGYSATAPFDRIIVTAGAWDIPPAWQEQLAPDGRLVVPLRIRGLTRAVALERHKGGWHSRSTEYCGFTPLRGAEHHPERNIQLNDEGTLILRGDDTQSADADGLRRALTQPPTSLWTGVTVTSKEKQTGFGDLEYWLAAPYGLCRLLTRTPNHGLVAPALAYGSMALLHTDSLAYLIKRPAVDPDTYELGVCAYGKDAATLTDQAAGQIRAWDTERELPTRIEAYPSDAPIPSDSSGTLLVAEKHHVRMVVRILPGTANT